ncbi:uncharacterized protein LODBEIA_P35920 [Lodderomyces beijingensis]|uniref:Cytochrome b5 heme-binding domain-containing protein n=1 Tax=Lodderomyces beijingensis TaxID=1775926 RepID=A0ABP0ZMK7_9ASCO
MSPCYLSLKQVKQHDKPHDLWMILYNKVYDLTEFQQDHIGGIEVLYDCGGSDATEAFEDVGHSDFAADLLEPFLVGEVRPEECREYRNNLLLVYKKREDVSNSSGNSTTKNYQRKGVITRWIEINGISLRNRFENDIDWKQYGDCISRWTSLLWLTCLAITSFALLILIQRLK